MVMLEDTPPNQVLIDLLQSKLPEYDEFKHVAFSARARRVDDEIPGLHAVLDAGKIQQRTIGSGKKALIRVLVKIVFVSTKPTEVWNIFKTITNIIVDNNQVQSTDAFSSTGLEWSIVDEVEFGEIMDERDRELCYFVMNVFVNYQK